MGRDAIQDEFARESAGTGWQLPHLLALDAPVVAIVWQRFLGKQFQTPVPLAVWLTLGFTVWALYLADRWLDAREPGPDTRTDRHRFAARNPRLIVVLAIVAFLGAVLGSLQLPGDILFAGAGLAGVVALYFLAVHFGKLPAESLGSKECFVGVLFAIGVSLPILISASVDGSCGIPAVVALAGLFAWNCLLIARWEADPTKPHRTSWRIAVAPILALVASFACPLGVTIAVGMALGLLGLLHFARNSLGSRRLRVLADVALLTPLAVSPWL